MRNLKEPLKIKQPGVLRSSVLLQSVRYLLMTRSYAYLSYHRFRFPGFAADLRTDLIVEGFPRCGNSYFEAALRHCEGFDKLNIAHHVHAPVHIKYGVRHGIPTAVLLRSPVESVASLLNMLPRHVGDRSLELRQYIAYYEVVRDRMSQLAVIPFPVLCEDFPSIVVELNRKFGLGLKCPEPFPQDKAWNEVDRLTESRTSKTSSGYSSAASDEFRAERKSRQETIGKNLRSRFPSLVVEAEAIYDELREACSDASFRISTC